MCGIAGICDPELGPNSPESPRLRRMLDMLHARGPDGEGVARLRGAQIGMRRLAITDPRAGGQPLWAEDGQVALVLNGEIYNHESLRRDLQHSGHRFAGGSDAEVLVHLYEDRGIDALSTLDGMYAFALWDGRRGELILARDPMGQKPLLVRALDEGVLFASSLSALVRAAPGAGTPGLDLDGLDSYLTYRTSVGRQSILSGIERVLPGEVLTVREGAVMRRSRRMRSRPFAVSVDRGEAGEDVVGRLEAALTKSVGRVATTEAPAGILLSAGLDSGLILALMGDGARGWPAYVADWEDAPRGISEWEAARDLAQSVGAVPHRVPVAPAALLDQLPRLAGLLDEPLGDPTALPLFAAVGAAAASGTRVLLTGEGADELFAGYLGYREPLATGPLAPLARSRFGTTAEALARRLGLPGAGVLERARIPAADRYLGPGWTFSLEERRRMYGDKPSLHHLSAEQAAREAARGYSADMWLQAMRAIDREVWLSDEALAKLDRVTMGLGVEARAPYLEPEVVQLADAMPAHWLISRHETKRVLRRVGERHLPPGYGAVKRGFPVPLTRLIHGPWREVAYDTLMAGDARVNAWLDAGAVRALFSPVQPRARGYRARQIYALLMLELWVRGVLEAPVRRPTASAPGQTCELGEDLVARMG